MIYRKLEHSNISKVSFESRLIVLGYTKVKQCFYLLCLKCSVINFKTRPRFLIKRAQDIFSSNHQHILHTKTSFLLFSILNLRHKTKQKVKKQDISWAYLAICKYAGTY